MATTKIQITHETAKTKPKPKSSSSPKKQTTAKKPASAQTSGKPLSANKPMKKVSAKAPDVVPMEEPEPTAAVAGARSFRSAMLVRRQKRELGVGDDANDMSRQNDVGNGFWPPLSPLL